MVELYSYPPPLDRLCTFGEAEWGTQRNVPDYVNELGLTREYVPAMIDIVRLWEDEDSLPKQPGASAPIHAWRALGQMRAIEAVEPLLNMQNQLDEESDDWYLSEFPDVFGMIGLPAVPPLAAYLNSKLNSEFPRISAADGLLRIAKRHPESRNAVVEVLRGQVIRCEESVYSLNGFVVSHLVELKAAKVAEAIERAFAAQVVEENVCGTWGSVRKELGVTGLGWLPTLRQDRNISAQTRPSVIRYSLAILLTGIVNGQLRRKPRQNGNNNRKPDNSDKGSCEKSHGRSISRIVCR